MSTAHEAPGPVATGGGPEERAEGWSVGELMAACLARVLRDGEVAVMGTASAIPQAACRLAQLTHAPSLWYVAGGTCSVNPYLAPLVPSACDFELLRAETAVPLSDIVLLEGRGDVFDTFFAGGLQIDAYGNCNLVAVGDWERPRLRGPGGVGLPFLGRVGRVLIYTTSHTPRTFVEQVDFVSGPGFLGGPAAWRAAGLAGGGPALVVTPLCTMDFDPETLRARLCSVHPGVGVDQVREATGFTLGGPDAVPETPAPTPRELAILRDLDPRGVLRA